MNQYLYVLEEEIDNLVFIESFYLILLLEVSMVYSNNQVRINILGAPYATRIAAVQIGIEISVFPGKIAG